MDNVMSQLSKSSILVVDDTPANLRLLTKLLNHQGYQVHSMPNGVRALASAQKLPPDLILLDIMMPDMDGYEVCRQLKANERTKDVPIIFISALDETFDKARAFSLGAVDYITKPFHQAEVLARVQTHLTLQDINRRLRSKNEQLEQQNKELDAFAHTTAHDLKNPLAVIMTYTDILYQDIATLDTEDLIQIGHETHKAAYKVINIIDSLLLLSSVRKGEIDMVPFDMNKVIKQVQEQLVRIITEYQGEIIVPEVWPEALGYAPWIEEVWVNYVSNGLKYGGQPPRLELGATPQPDGMIRFWVQDNGTGLNPEAQAALFTEFTRLGELGVEGHGLGLSIVRRIVDKLGGQVGVESKGVPGQGSIFYFTLAAAEKADK